MVLARILRSVGSYLAGGPQRFLVGRDLAGNRYYEYPPTHQPTASSSRAGRSRRVVKYIVERPIEEYAGSGGDAEQLPVQWKMWLRHTRSDAPSLQELEDDKKRIDTLKVLVKEIEERDRKDKEEMRRVEQEQVAKAGQIEEPQQPAPQQEAAGPRIASRSERLRRGISAVPTSEVTDSDVKQERARRVPISVQRGEATSAAASTQDPPPSPLQGAVLEQREADNDVWRASKERIQKQDRGGKVDSSGGRRSFATMARRPTVTDLLQAQGTRSYSTGPIRPGSSSSATPSRPPPPSFTPPPRAPLAAKPSSADGAASTAPPPQAPRRDLPGLVYIAGGAGLGLALMAVWTMPDPWALKEDAQLSPQKWTPTRLVDSKEATTTREGEEKGNGEHKVLTLQLPGASSAPTTSSSPLRISSLSVKQPHMMIERSYTPLFAPTGQHQVQLIVKRYQDGEMGRYLHSLQPGRDEVEVRGWLDTWKPRQGAERPDEIVMIVGGTGIAPAHQLLDSCLGSSAATTSSPPHFTLLYASRDPSSLLLLPELRAMAERYPDKLDVRLRVDEWESGQQGWLDWLRGSSNTKTVDGFEVKKGRINAEDLKAALTANGKAGTNRAILVCGPEGMVEAIAGARRVPQIEQQQAHSAVPLGGLLAAVEGVDPAEVGRL